jgi:hypothetical protein
MNTKFLKEFLKVASHPGLTNLNHEGIELLGKLYVPTIKGSFGKWRIQVDGRELKGILGNFDL